MDRQLLRDAQTLAMFSNLTEKEVEYFRQNYPDFVPAVWWAGPAWKKSVETPSPWMQERDFLRTTWVAGFPADNTLKLATTNLFGIAHLLASTGFPADIPNPFFVAPILTQVLDRSSTPSVPGLKPSGFFAPDGTDITEAVKSKMASPQIWPYQRAVLFLHTNSWRASFCENCGQRYIKEKPPQRFCGDACFKESRKAYKRKLWAKHPEWLKNRKQRKKARR